MSLRRGVRLPVVVSIARSARVVPVAVASLLGAGLIVGLTSQRIGLGEVDATAALHLSMAVTLMGAPFVLDDPARELTEALPIDRIAVAAVRMLLALIPVSLSWIVQLALVPTLVSSSARFDAPGLFVELYAVLAWVWASAAWRSSRDRSGTGSTVALPALVAFCVGAVFLPEPLLLIATPADAAWFGSRLRWWALLVVGTVVLVSVVVRPSLHARTRAVREAFQRT